eukprot:PhF_6_TR7322/c0_g1_i1/m.10979/K01047/PLA2G, SPLA2; secretory phospholipase A2
MKMRCCCLFMLLFIAVVCFAQSDEDILMAMDCSFKCPDGSKPKKQKASHVPSSNGCGTAGFKVDPEFGFEPCCDEHDKCYDTCGSSRSHCDDVFEKCMKDHCQSLKPKPSPEAVTNDELEIEHRLQEGKREGPFAHLKTPSDVALFLRKGGFLEHAKIFIDHKVDGERLESLTESQLRSLGITTIGERRKLMSYINQAKSDFLMTHDESNVAPKSNSLKRRKDIAKQQAKKEEDDVHDRCMKQADMFHGFSSAFGCGAWKSAQTEACDCRTSNEL